MLALAEGLSVTPEQVRAAFRAAGYISLTNNAEGPPDDEPNNGAGRTAMQVLVGQRLYALGQRGRTLSYKAAAGRSRGMLSHGTLQRLYTGQSAGPWDDSLLRGLADALDVPHAMVAQAAAASLGQARNRVVWPLKYSQLSDTAWQAPTQPRRQPAQDRERQHRPGRRPGGNPSGPGPDVACARKQ